jgi:hypothetical protein
MSFYLVFTSAPRSMAPTSEPRSAAPRYRPRQRHLGCHAVGSKICDAETCYLGATSSGADPSGPKMSLHLPRAKRNFFKKGLNCKKIGNSHRGLCFRVRSLFLPLESPILPLSSRCSVSLYRYLKFVG